MLHVQWARQLPGFCTNTKASVKWFSKFPVALRPGQSWSDSKEREGNTDEHSKRREGRVRSCHPARAHRTQEDSAATRGGQMGARAATLTVHGDFKGGAEMGATYVERTSEGRSVM